MWAVPVGAYGKPRMAAFHSTPFLMTTAKALGPLKWTQAIRTIRSMWAPARSGPETAFPSEMVCTSRWTVAATGVSWALKTQSALPGSLSIRTIRRKCMWACLGLCGAIPKNGASTSPRTEVPVSPRSYTSIKQRVVLIWPWIQTIPMCFTPRCGNFDARPGHSIREAKRVHCTNPQTGETAGRRSIMGFRRASWAAWALLLHPRIQKCSTRS